MDTAADEPAADAAVKAAADEAVPPQADKANASAAASRTDKVFFIILSPFSVLFFLCFAGAPDGALFCMIVLYFILVKL